jgi:hypothetical protein
MSPVSSRSVADSTTTVANRSDATAGERGRIQKRRDALQLPKIAGDPIGLSGLAISGGGIRSATIGFGVLEALATAPRPDGDEVPAGATASSLLSRFDYLSTVSGGGYIGGFLCSLFIPGRLRKRESNGEPTAADFEQAAKDAYATLAYIPPSRLRASDTLESENIGHCPTAWLRENGRYLTPTGAGDSLYAAATALRNWLAVHYMLGTLFICAFAALALARNALAYYSLDYRAFEAQLLQNAQAAGSHQLWWSPLWWLIPTTIAVWLSPCGIAFWLSAPRSDRDESKPPRMFDAAACAALVVVLVLGAPVLIKHIIPHPDWVAWRPSRQVVYGAAFLAAITFLGFLFHVFFVFSSDTITAYRVKTTQAAAKGIAWLLGLVVVAVSDTGGQQLDLWLWGGNVPFKTLTPIGVLGAIVWLIRKVAKLTDGETESTSRLKRLPLDVISAMVGGVALLLVGCLWNALVQFVSWPARPDTAHIGMSWQIVTQGSVFFMALILAIVSGRFGGFINLSTLQAIYGARLTRAYLGASNGRRFDPVEPAPAGARQPKAAATAKSQRARSVAEPLPEDQIELYTYYKEGSLAPLHIINVTVNQTIDPSEQLVQRDRKGKPLAVLPHGFSIDGRFFRNYATDAAYNPERLSVGQWIGTSGAAFTTGLGRATGVGASLALGLANVRLGTWWYSGQGRDNATGLEALFKLCFPAQTYLLYEFLARFYGRRRTLQYLSDGGHFENTALYELLRPAREVRFLVVCDNGCDPNYRFDDLANLIRLARIDYRLNIEIDTRIAEHNTLKQVFGTLNDFRTRKGEAIVSDQCALMLKVFDCEQSPARDRPIARIVVLKPRVIASAPEDVCDYRANSESFPQQTTADQFFDEAQWESYRALGYRIGTLVFGSADKGGLGADLWAYLQEEREAHSTSASAEGS